MFQQLSFAVLLLTLGQFTNAQLPFFGRCPEVNVMSKFDLNSYNGTWYEYSKYPFIFEIGQKCMYAEYQDLGNSTVSVMNAAINRFTGNPTNITGYAKVLGPGRLAVVFRNGQSETEPNYLVLDTDYKKYAVVYSCTNFSNIFHTQVVWILTRERKPSAETIATAKKVMDDNRLSKTYLIDTVQDGCPAPKDSVNFDNWPEFNAISNA